jgi:glycosylphosphatidylinositol transamidase
VTLYATPSTGPHGFHTLGRTLESTLRSQNNLLERLHASYFFYLLPRPGKFIPVGHYLPSAILIGSSVTISGFDCPDPISGLLYLSMFSITSAICWLLRSPLWAVLAVYPLSRVRLDGTTRKSIQSLSSLLYGALIPTLAMVNFPQAILLAGVTLLHLFPWRVVRRVSGGLIVVFGVWQLVNRGRGVDLRKEWEEVGNLFWPGVFGVWIPLCLVGLVI